MGTYVRTVPERLPPRIQGDFGELSALNWFVRRGDTVFLPYGHSPDVDLVAWMDGRYVGVQVKTTTRLDHKGRFCAAICTRGGNQSWHGLSKRFSAQRCDYLFVHAGDGRRWFIPSNAVEGTTAITLGGPKYAEFEIERSDPIPLRPAA